MRGKLEWDRKPIVLATVTHSLYATTIVLSSANEKHLGQDGTFTCPLLETSGYSDMKTMMLDR
jgi:hypothetical protein